MTVATMTDKQRRALEAMEAARSQGLSLTQYARTQGLVAREIYDALAALRRRGVLPKSGRKARSKFVAVRVAQPAAVAVSATHVIDRHKGAGDDRRNGASFQVRKTDIPEGLRMCGFGSVGKC